MFHCPICGADTTRAGGSVYTHQCKPRTLARVERELREYEDGGIMFSNCGVCGKRLYGAEEELTGVCGGCGAE